MGTLVNDSSELDGIQDGLAKDAAKAGERVGLKADAIVIRGGKPLTGRVEVRGAKNLVTKAMVASLLGRTPSVLSDIPQISEIQVVTNMLQAYGVAVTSPEDGVLVMDPSNVERAQFHEIDALAGSSRIPILFCGPLLHALGEALIPDLGGCRIGDRPIDFHLDALRAFGAIVDKSYEGIRITAPNGLTGANIELPYPSVGATEQVLLTGVRAKGVTELKNAAIEPEIMDLIAILQKMGAIIWMEPNRTIFIEGVDQLTGYSHRAIFDRNEAASWASAALATKGDIFVAGAKQQELMTFLNVFRKVGGAFDVREDGIRFWHPGGPLNPVQVETDVHPGFMTDWQQPLIVALTQAEGVSVVHETVYENRLGFTSALVEMGADIVVHSDGLESVTRRVPRRKLEQAAVITGPTPLHAADVRVPDLRGGFSYLIAALAAEGTSTVSNLGLISRGYERFVQKLEDLGADFDLV
jgi:UDP-N-acetylglucosamine 1-carboxyvinyltransferase